MEEIKKTAEALYIQKLVAEISEICGSYEQYATAVFPDGSILLFKIGPANLPKDERIPREELIEKINIGSGRFFSSIQKLAEYLPS